MDFWAIVPAAGSGSRMGLGYNKVFYPLGGYPILYHTLKALLAVPDCRGLVLAVSSGDMEVCGGILGMLDEADRCLCTLCLGGNTRQESVSNAFHSLIPILPRDRDPLILVHDGARPLIRVEEVRRVLVEAEATGAAILAVPAKDTVKFSDSKGFVESTPSRDKVWIVQTPQVIKASMLSAALSAAESAGIGYTDESSAVEALGYPVKLVMGSYTNIKVTTPEDIRVATALSTGGHDL